MTLLADALALERRMELLRAAMGAIRDLFGVEVPAAGGFEAGGFAEEVAVFDRRVRSGERQRAVSRDPGDAIRELEREGARLASVADDWTRRIRAFLDEAPVGELRARPPAVRDGARANVGLLLDLVLDDESGLAARWPLVELLVTLLVTERQGRDCRVVRDPASLTRRMAQCVAAQPDAGSTEIERRLLEEAERIDERSLDEALAVTASLGAAVGPGLLAPAALRALVFYNARLWSRLPEPEPVEAPAGDPARVSAPLRISAAPPAPTARRPPPAPVVIDRAWTGAERVGVPRVKGAASVRRPAPVAARATAPMAPQWNVPDLPLAPRPVVPVARPRAAQGAIRTVLAAGMMGLAAWVWLAPPAGSVRVLSDRNLAAVSPVLQTGYRDRAGTGPLFIGTVGSSWESMAAPTRRSIARTIVDRLSGAGVREVLLYDHALRLVARSQPPGSLQVTE